MNNISFDMLWIWKVLWSIDNSNPSTVSVWLEESLTVGGQDKAVKKEVIDR